MEHTWASTFRRAVRGRGSSGEALEGRSPVNTCKRWFSYSSFLPWIAEGVYCFTNQKKADMQAADKGARFAQIPVELLRCYDQACVWSESAPCTVFGLPSHFLLQLRRGYGPDYYKSAATGGGSRPSAAERDKSYADKKGNTQAANAAHGHCKKGHK